jgi:hypothetical protein
MSFISLRKSTLTPETCALHSHHSADRNRYILHVDSGPFISSLQAHYDITFSCLAVLDSSLHIATTSSFPVPQEALESSIAKGFFNLHQYATRFWMDHLGAYLQGCADIEINGPLASLLEDLSRAHKAGPSTAYSESIALAPSFGNRAKSDLAVLFHNKLPRPQAQQFIQDAIRIKHKAEQKQKSFISILGESVNVLCP